MKNFADKVAIDTLIEAGFNSVEEIRVFAEENNLNIDYDKAAELLPESLNEEVEVLTEEAIDEAVTFFESGKLPNGDYI